MSVLHSFLWPNNIPLLFIPILVGGHLGFYSLVLINNALYLYVKVFAWSYNFIFLGSLPRNEIAGSNGNCQTVFQNGYNFFFNSHQQCTRVFVSPHFYQCLLLSDILLKPSL